MKVYNILEVANTHGGESEYLFSLINEFENLTEDFGIKFQPFHYDLISTKEFEWYETYKKLFFEKEQWYSIITEAKKTKDIWLDIFDEYSVEILLQNLNNIYGIKFQSSVLKNRKLLRALNKIDLANKKLIINLSGYSLEQIEQLIENIKYYVNTEQIILQVGFQDYPTKLSDSGLGKISKLQEYFDYEISFTDHLDGNSEESLRLPIAAVLKGAKYIEKHIMHSKLETKYDHFSSITIEKYNKYLEILTQYIEMFKDKFVNEREKEYLYKSMQIPITSKELIPGKPLDLMNDIVFKRSNKKGLPIEQIEDLNSSFHILRRSKKENESFYTEDFKKANIAVIIAVRLKSSRLPRKALLKVGDLTSIELCIKNCLKFSNVDHTIIATSNLEEDAELENYTYDPSVIFHRGHPEDVIQRYLDIIDKLKIDVIIRLTGDCPYPSDEILQILLKSHFENGADYTRPQKAAIGTGLEIMNVSALKKIKEYFPLADYSEYMTYYFTNNPSHFKLNFVNLPNELVRDYRLTLDYQEDLYMFNKIEDHFAKDNRDYTLEDIFKFLDENEDIANMNSKCEVKYFSDQELIKKINEKTTIKRK